MRTLVTPSPYAYLSISDYKSPQKKDKMRSDYKIRKQMEHYVRHEEGDIRGRKGEKDTGHATDKFPFTG